MIIPEHLKDQIILLPNNRYKVKLKDNFEYVPLEDRFKKQIKEIFRIVKELDEYQLTQDSN
jgi:hypothetical protein